MNEPFDPPPAGVSPLQQFLFSQIPVAIFLVLASAGMFFAYLFFSPPSNEATQVLSFAGADTKLVAAITKPIAIRPVTQRFNPSPPPLNIALIVGHRGNDSGAVCEADGLQEVQITTNVADKVVLELAKHGYSVILLDEFDPRLPEFDGIMLLSIHADSCGYFGETATGFKAAGSSYADSSKLLNCVNQEYAIATSLGIHENTITTHMTDYHAFREMKPNIPAVILELGFMYLDRELLTTYSDLPALGVVNSIRCFVEN
jgi:N-acetylmuramoyl-L-alanine amidase